MQMVICHSHVWQESVLLVTRSAQIKADSAYCRLHGARELTELLSPDT
jgi:hypothetical protein